MIRPDWCEDKTCSPLSMLATKGGGSCIGKLIKAKDHITVGVNTMSSCCYDKVSKVVQTSHINQADIIVDVYLGGLALKAQGLGIPAAIVDNLPKEDWHG